MSCFIPLISPRAFKDYTPREYLDYVKSLHKEPERAAPPAEFSVRLNDKGNAVLTVRRDPKYLTPSEVDAIANTLGWKKQAAWLMVSQKKIQVKREEKRK